MDCKQLVVRSMRNFKQFDTVNGASDHHFVNDNLKGKECKGKVIRKIMQEWEILGKSLPDSIFVRVYEDRVDLIRAVIIGPPCTPYYNGLFFFDICFPKDYPAHPPKVYYHSFGMRMNPNLYAAGFVCLSLLNTWIGNKTEKWNPSQSTVLQVLLSLQALVLNEKPYFNEPGREQMVGKLNWEKESLVYNECTWMKSCKLMIFLLRKPPTHFKYFVDQYFCQRAGTILLASNAYISGHARIGDPIPLVTANSPNHLTYEVSENFRSSMGELYPRLLDQFASKGASVKYFRTQFQAFPKPDAVIKKKKKKDGIVKKMLNTFKKLIGLK